MPLEAEELQDIVETGRVDWSLSPFVKIRKMNWVLATGHDEGMLEFIPSSSLAQIIVLKSLGLGFHKINDGDGGGEGVITVIWRSFRVQRSRNRFKRRSTNDEDHEIGFLHFLQVQQLFFGVALLCFSVVTVFGDDRIVFIFSDLVCDLSTYNILDLVCDLSNLVQFHHYELDFKFRMQFEAFLLFDIRFSLLDLASAVLISAKIQLYEFFL
ncbi:hypothetical protein LOK49_LG14G01647 [Camellia lanceoleosa]|uniref:Uncharacterized protein n=1 Tax=Camellia lanceoleosa TaxID=1840588 RepID=A0ACC0FAE0_9ERIC|nr:hypothetical protein LOK49_LG14G01647 [Camellia lanceoleosa]